MATNLNEKHVDRSMEYLHPDEDYPDPEVNMIYAGGEACIEDFGANF